MRLSKTLLVLSVAAVLAACSSAPADESSSSDVVAADDAKVDGVMRVDLSGESEASKAIIKNILLLIDRSREVNAAPKAGDDGVLPEESGVALDGFIAQIDKTVSELPKGEPKALGAYLTKLRGWSLAIRKQAGDAAIAAAKHDTMDAWVSVVEGKLKYQPYFDPQPTDGYCQFGLLDSEETARSNGPTAHQEKFDRELADDIGGGLTAWPKGGAPAALVMLKMIEEPGILWMGSAEGNFEPGGRVAKTVAPNVGDAQQELSLGPVAKRLLAPARLTERRPADMGPLMALHELMHAIGPKTVLDKGGVEVPVALEEDGHFASIPGGFVGLDEPKADVGSLWLSQKLIALGELPAATLPARNVEFLVTLFAYLPGDETDSHTRGAWANTNFLLEAGAFKFDAAAVKWDIDQGRLAKVVPQLLMKWIELQRAGDDAAAKKFMDRYGVKSEPIVKSLDAIKDIKSFDKLNMRFDRSQVGLPDTTSF